MISHSSQVVAIDIDIERSQTWKGCMIADISDWLSISWY